MLRDRLAPVHGFNRTIAPQRQLAAQKPPHPRNEVRCTIHIMTIDDVSWM